MRLQTASEVISFLKQLERQSADFYKWLAKNIEAHKDLFLGFAKENEKNINNIERTYYGVITDAIEGCYAFAIETDIYQIEDKCVLEGNYSDAISRVLQIESTILQFYIDAAKQSHGLMADIPRVMERIAKVRADRVQRLNTMLKGTQK